ncbi:ATP-grasp domain-containing protein [Pendulispora rubella]|uniref:ATP-grasp domain-containing protein n=1 Tax=Pendulispora rubella TaxID=2741070 RepID=A0ABZ2L1L5_9BACT
MRITVLTYLEKQGDTSYDPVADQVANALRAEKHTVKVFAVHGDIVTLVEGLREQRPTLVFNLMEAFGGNLFGEIGVAGALQLLSLRHTGGGPGEFYLQQDKALTKELLAFHGVPFPNYAVFRKDNYPDTSGRLRMPLIVKPLRMDASIGIESNSLVRSATQMMKRIVAIHEKVKDAALVEEYIEGREFYVGVLGNRKPIALPPIEMDFSGLPAGMPRVLGRRAKWVKSSPEYKGTRSKIAEIPNETKLQLQRVAIDAYRALRVRDYGRIDLRLTPGGEVYVIEVNASCYLEKSSEFATAAQAAGIRYANLVNAIAKLALARFRRPY